MVESVQMNWCLCWCVFVHVTPSCLHVLCMQTGVYKYIYQISCWHAITSKWVWFSHASSAYSSLTLFSAWRILFSLIAFIFPQSACDTRVSVFDWKRRVWIASFIAKWSPGSVWCLRFSFSSLPKEAVHFWAQHFNFPACMSHYDLINCWHLFLTVPGMCNSLVQSCILRTRAENSLRQVNLLYNPVGSSLLFLQRVRGYFPVCHLNLWRLMDRMLPSYCCFYMSEPIKLHESLPAIFQSIQSALHDLFITFMCF